MVRIFLRHFKFYCIFVRVIKAFDCFLLWYFVDFIESQYDRVNCVISTADGCIS